MGWNACLPPHSAPPRASVGGWSPRLWHHSSPSRHPPPPTHPPTPTLRIRARRSSPASILRPDASPPAARTSPNPGSSPRPRARRRTGCGSATSLARCRPTSRCGRSSGWTLPASCAVTCSPSTLLRVRSSPTTSTTAKSPRPARSPSRQTRNAPSPRSTATTSTSTTPTLPKEGPSSSTAPSSRAPTPATTSPWGSAPTTRTHHLDVA